MTKAIESTGIPVVQYANLIPVAKTVGANRMVPTISIPYPFGDPATSKEEQYKLRTKLVEIGLKALTTNIKEPGVFKNV